MNKISLKMHLCNVCSAAIFMTIIVSSASAPSNKPTLYSAIVQQCPMVTNITDFESQPQFLGCNNWNKIKSVTSFKSDKTNEIMCMLFYNSFIKYCSSTTSLNTRVPKDLNGKYNLSICDKLEVICSTTAEFDLSKLIPNKDVCITVCNDFGYPHAMCSLSYYFAQLSNKPNKITPSGKQPDKTIPINDGKQILVSAPVTNHNPSKPQAEPPFPQIENLGADYKNVASGAVASQVIDLPKNDIPSLMKQEEVRETAVKPEGKPLQTSQTQSTNQEPNLVVSLDKAKESENLQKDVKSDVIKPEDATLQPSMNNVPDNNLLEEPDYQQQPGSQEDDQEVLPEAREETRKPAKPEKVEDSVSSVNYFTEVDGDSYFFTYFMLLCIIIIVGYICYHNKQKLLALVLEGRKGRRQARGRRPNSANYHKLDSNLEEAITSSVSSKNTSNVIY